MTNVKVTCDCGAIYEMIETEGSSRELKPFKCVLCEKELFTWEGANVGQFCLVWRPDSDQSAPRHCLRCERCDKIPAPALRI